jgi:hypothetical protein
MRLVLDNSSFNEPFLQHLDESIAESWLLDPTELLCQLRRRLPVAREHSKRLSERGGHVLLASALALTAANRRLSITQD